jgi:hypothetical protein
VVHKKTAMNYGYTHANKVYSEVAPIRQRANEAGSRGANAAFLLLLSLLSVLLPAMDSVRQVCGSVLIRVVYVHASLMADVSLTLNKGNH